MAMTSRVQPRAYEPGDGGYSNYMGGGYTAPWGPAAPPDGWAADLGNIPLGVPENLPSAGNFQIYAVEEPVGLIPAMVSNLAPEGIASSSTNGGSTSAYYAFSSDDTDGWLSDGSALPQQLAYQFPHAVSVESYGIVPCNEDTIPGDDVISAAMAAPELYLNGWQGRVRLAAEERTNLLPFTDFYGSGGYFSGTQDITVTPARLAPDGTNRAVRFAKLDLYVSRFQKVKVTPGLSLEFAFWARAEGVIRPVNPCVRDATHAVDIIYGQTQPGNRYTPDGTWRRFAWLFTVPTGCTELWVYQFRDSPVALDVTTFGASVSTVGGGLIWTSGCPVVVPADYTLATAFGSDGSLAFTLGQPLNGETLEWANAPAGCSLEMLDASHGVLRRPVNRTAESWQLQGWSSSTGWVTLDSRSAVRNWQHGVESTFTIATPGAYTTYRLNITANGGHAVTGVRQLQLYSSAAVIYTRTSDGVVSKLRMP